MRLQGVVLGPEITPQSLWKLWVTRACEPQALDASGSGDDVAARLYAVAPGAPTTQTFGPTRPTGGAVELSETDLVKRGPYLVDADTDRLYTYYAGAVFASREAKPTFGDRAPLLFFVTDDDRLAFLEPAGSRTWSEIVARKAWRQRVSAA